MSQQQKTNLRMNKKKNAPVRNPPNKVTRLSREVSIGGQLYTVGNLGNGKGNFTGGQNGSQMIIEKTEPLGSVIASATAQAFSASVDQFIYPMNPNLNWLQNMANSFSTYEILAFEITYIPAVPTTATGSVSMSFYEDLLDAVPTSRTQLLVSEQALFAPIYAGGEGGRYLQQFGSPKGNIVSFMLPKHAIADENGVPKRFKIIKPATIATMLTSDTNLAKSSLANYVVGRLVVGTDGCTASQNVGEIFVRYKLRLSGQVAIGNQA